MFLLANVRPGLSEHFLTPYLVGHIAEVKEEAGKKLQLFAFKEIVWTDFVHHFVED